MSKYSGKLFVLYEGEVKPNQIPSPALIARAFSESEARERSHWFRDRDATWYEYDVKDGRILRVRQRLDLPFAMR